MKERMRRILHCVGAAGAVTIMAAVPAIADTTEDHKNIEVQSEQSEETGEEAAYDWSDKVAANVRTYANIREGADVNSQRTGRLPSGAVATVIGSENGWLQVTSGAVDGYIREDLIVSGEDARILYETTHGSSDVLIQASTVNAEAEPVQQTEPAEQAEPQAGVEALSVSTSELDLMAAIIECEAGGESYEGKIGVGAVIMNRMRSGEFPDTLSEVVYQSGQFQPTWTGKLDSVLSRGASEACYEAARDVFAGANTIGDRLFFHAGGGSGLTIGNQTFY